MFKILLSSVKIMLVLSAIVTSEATNYIDDTYNF